MDTKCLKMNKNEKEIFKVNTNNHIIRMKNFNSTFQQHYVQFTPWVSLKRNIYVKNQKNQKKIVFNFMKKNLEKYSTQFPQKQCTGHAAVNNIIMYIQLISLKLLHQRHGEFFFKFTCRNIKPFMGENFFFFWPKWFLTSHPISSKVMNNFKIPHHVSKTYKIMYSNCSLFFLNSWKSKKMNIWRRSFFFLNKQPE